MGAVEDGCIEGNDDDGAGVTGGRDIDAE